ncbi:MAG: hypothetical protein ACYSR9_09565 [Planctomycetota bacterium]|jgi:hypothetical protein
MNTQKKIEQSLRAAPKPQVPDGLLNKLEADLSAGDIKKERSALRRWFAPAGGPISIWRVAVAAAIAIVVLLPLTYGAVKIVKVYSFTIEDRQVNEDGGITSTTTSVKLSGYFDDEEQAKRVWQETQELKKAGKYERTFLKEVERNGVKRRIYQYRYTLSNGEVVKFAESESVKEEENQ